MRLLRSRLAVVSSLAILAGCASTPANAPPAAAPAPPAATAPAAPAAPTTAEDALPPILHDLDLTEAQTKEALHIIIDVQNQADSFWSAVEGLGRSVAGAARLCKGSTPFIAADAERTVREGEALRAPVLDAVQRAHKLLTPAQRQKLSQRLVEGDNWAKRERRNSDRTKELGPALELSNMQMMSILVKAGVLWTRFADRAEPWRAQYRAAITNFARDDFDVHKEPVATAPAVAMVVEFVREGLGMLIPVLEPKQCEVLGNLIDARLDDQVKGAAARAAARAQFAEQK
jgi:hypothetical protein